MFSNALSCKLTALVAVAAFFVQSTVVQAADVRLFTTLTKTAAAGATAKGKAKYQAEDNNTIRKFESQVENLPRTITRVTFKRNGATIGSANVALGTARLNISTLAGQAVPVMAAGDTITVVNAANGALLFSGKLAVLVKSGGSGSG